MPREGLSTAGSAAPVVQARLGCGLAVAALLLIAVECLMHVDAVLHQYRSVFAAGRALDKALYAVANCPSLVLLGNSRADNGFDPRTVIRELGVPLERGAFNLGIPGADTRVLAGIVDRLDAGGCLREGGVRKVVLAMDEALVQPIDTLGQTVFFASPARLWSDGQYHDALRATLRLYGYTNNLRQLREPAALQRFVQASLGPVEPLGGGAAEHLGYRAGASGLQDAQSAQLQEASSVAPPDPVNVRQLWRLLDLLAARGVQVAVTFPPLLNREGLYLAGATPAGAPYRAIVAELRQRAIPLIALDDGKPRESAEFVNPGHLNDRGAQRYSRLLAQGLQHIWGPPNGVPPAAARAQAASS